MHIDELKSMTDDEINNLNRTLGKRLMKVLAVKAVVTIGVIVITNVIIKKLANEDAD